MKIICKKCGGNKNRKINKNKPHSNFNCCPECKKN